MIINAFDYILLPFYILFFFIIIIRIKKKHYANSPFGKYLIYGFWAKIFASIAFALITQYLYPGDSFMYYTAGLDFKESVFKNFPHNFHFLFSPAQEFEDYYERTYDNRHVYGYMAAGSNLMAAKFVAFFSFFTFNRYLIISLCFGLVSLSGLWQCFKLLSEKYPLLRKQIAISFLFLPSVLFWGSGVLKDPLCVGFLGWLFVSGYKFFIQKHYTLKLIFIFVTSLYLVSVLKSYILVAFLPFFALWIIKERVNRISNSFIRIVILLIFIICTGFTLYLNKDKISDYMGEYTFENLVETVKTSKDVYYKTTNAEGSFIKADDIDPTFKGIVKAVPSSIITALFRPYIWESKKILTLVSALENLIILLFTLYVLVKTRVYNFIKIIFQHNLLFFFFSFSVVFAAAIGLTCYNFGTLVRYKIPCMPFYLTALILIMGYKKDMIKIKNHS